MVAPHEKFIYLQYYIFITQFGGRHEDMFNPESHVAWGGSSRETWIFWVEQIFMSPD